MCAVVVLVKVGVVSAAPMRQGIFLLLTGVALQKVWIKNQGQKQYYSIYSWAKLLYMRELSTQE